MIQDTEHDLQARIRELEGTVIETQCKWDTWQTRAEIAEQRITKAKTILRNTVEKKYSHFILDIDEALNALEGQ